MAEHVVGPDTTVLNNFTDGTPRIRAGDYFYATSTTYTCVGGRVYVPAGSAAIGGKVRVTAYLRTAGGIPTSGDMNFALTNAQQSKVVDVTASGWIDVYWDTPFNFSSAANSNFIFIGYEYLTSGDAYTGYYQAGSLTSNTPYASPTLTDMYLAESGLRGMYQIGTAETAFGVLNSTWYGAGIIVEDNVAITGQTVYGYPELTITDFTSTDEGGVIYTLATEFYVTKQAWLKEIRYMTPTAGAPRNLNDREVLVWQVDSSTTGTKVVANITHTPGDYGQWQIVTLPTPYELTPGQHYRAGLRFDANDGYTVIANWFTGADRVQGYLTVPASANAIGGTQGSYTFNAGDIFPSSSFSNSFYGVDVGVVDTIGFNPLSLDFDSVFWADDLSGATRPAEGGVAPGPVTNLGSDGGTWTKGNAVTWTRDFGGLGKDAAVFGSGTYYSHTRAAAAPTRSWVLVGRAKGTSDADWVDTSPTRTLFDANGGSFRSYVGNVVSAGTADTVPHLVFVEAIGSGGVCTITIDGVVKGTGTVAENGGSSLWIGDAGLGSGNVQGSEIAFAGYLTRTLTTQEKDDLLAWYQATYLGVSANAADFSYDFTISATGLTPGFNTVRQENLLAGESSAQIAIGGAGDLTNLGYAKQFSADAGTTVDFACSGDGTVIDIYRIGHYGDAQWHKVTTITNTATTQPTPNTQGAGVNGGYEASNWTTTASWAVPEYQLSGLHIGVLRNAALNNASYIPFVVRNDARAAKIVVKVSETTWGAAYNNFGTMASPAGGKNLYGSGAGIGSITDRTHFVSFMRPIITRDGVAQTYWMACELPLIDWLERNGYDVKYVAGMDLDRDPTILDDASIFISSGHDEYWSDGMRSTVENWRAASSVGDPRHCLFMSGNEVFWRIRFETDYSGFYCYKDTMPGPSTHVAGTALDPVSWTGTYKDTRWGSNRAEWFTTGTDFRMNGVIEYGVTLSSATYGTHPVWDNTALESGDVSFTQCVGFEADQAHPTQPSESWVYLASQVINIDGRYADNNGQNYSGNGSLNPWAIVAQRFGVESVTVGFGTAQWQWLLSDRHDRYTTTNVNINAKQFMVNLLGDLDAQPDGLEAGLVARTPQSLDIYGLATPGLGSADFAHAWTVAAVGFSPVVGMHYGAAAFTYNYATAASGTTPAVPMHYGAAALTNTWAVSALATVLRSGSAALSNQWTLGATGVTPDVPIPLGAAAFAVQWQTAATATTERRGAVALSVDWRLRATAVEHMLGAAHLTHLWVTQATGNEPPNKGGTGFGYAFALGASGYRPPVMPHYGAADFAYDWKMKIYVLPSLAPDGTPIRLGVGSFARGYIQEMAESLMDSVIRISQPVTVYDPVTRRQTTGAGTVFYEGPARIWEVPGGSTAIIGEDEIVMSTTYMSVPYSVFPLPEADYLITIIESVDPDLVGRTVNLDTMVRGGLLAASRQFQVTLSSSQRSTW